MRYYDACPAPLSLYSISATSHRHKRGEADLWMLVMTGELNLSLCDVMLLESVPNDYVTASFVHHFALIVFIRRLMLWKEAH